MLPNLGYKQMKNMFNIYYINHENASETFTLFDNEIVEKIARIKIQNLCYLELQMLLREQLINCLLCRKA